MVPAEMWFIGTILLVMFIGDIAWWIRAHCWLRPLQQRALWRTALGIFMILQILGLAFVLANRTLDVTWNGALARTFMSLVYIWHCLVLIPTLFLWIFVGIPVRIIRIFREFFGVRRIDPPRLALPDQPLTRREFFGAVTAVTPSIISLGATAVALPQLQQFRVRRLIVPIDGLPPPLEGLTIAHVSDLHVGRFTHGSILERVVAETNALDADLILLTGDLINTSLRDLPPAIETVKAMRSHHGIFMCEGNHDLFDNPTEFRRRVDAAGIPLLVNDTATLAIRGITMQILGLRWGPPPDTNDPALQRGDNAISASMIELLPFAKPDAFRILLAHHPHAFDYAPGIPLTLAGHTHGGQIMFADASGFGPLMYRYWSGLYRHENRAIVVSNGVGNWFPLRTRAPAEILHLTLQKA